jgi:aromatic ring-opening dioxygenase LigB subunit
MTAAKTLHAAGQQAAQLFQELQPEVLFLVTPHGTTDRNNFVFYQHHAAEGVQLAGRNPAKHFKAVMHIDTPTTTELVDFLSNESQNISVLHDNSRTTAVHQNQVDLTKTAIPLSWGEVIPFAVLGNPSHVPVVIMAIPPPQGSQTLMIKELWGLGRLLGQFFSQPNRKRTLVLISADLAHTHPTEQGSGRQRHPCLTRLEVQVTTTAAWLQLPSHALASCPVVEVMLSQPHFIRVEKHQQHYLLAERSTLTQQGAPASSVPLNP